MACINEDHGPILTHSEVSGMTQVEKFLLTKIFSCREQLGMKNKEHNQFVYLSSKCIVYLFMYQSRLFFLEAIF